MTNTKGNGLFQTLTNLAFPFTDKALDAIYKFKDMGTDYVQVKYLTRQSSNFSSL